LQTPWLPELRNSILAQSSLDHRFKDPISKLLNRARLAMNVEENEITQIA